MRAATFQAPVTDGSATHDEPDGRGKCRLRGKNGNEASGSVTVASGGVQKFVV